MKLKFINISSTIVFLMIINLCAAQGQKGIGGYLKASIFNKNVYKTKVPMKVFKVYQDNTVPPLDSFTINPVPGEYIRYKVIADEGDFKYIRILPGCYINSNKDITKVNSAGSLHAEDIILRVSKKLLEPNAYYLASSALIGKVITLPVRVRKEYWNEKNTVLQGSLSLGMGFGWKFKIGNHPYRTHYISIIAYGAGISQQKYFNLAGKYSSGKDSLSAKTDEFAVSYLTQGIAYEYDRFNIGIFWGKDKMFGSLKNWVYQDKWWWGIGVGYELFK